MNTSEPAEAKPPPPAAGAPLEHGNASAAAERRPPRYPYWRAVAIGGGVWLVLLLAARLYWDHQADATWDRLIAGYRATGQPVFREDFEPATRPADDQNAAYWISQAIQDLDVNVTPQYEGDVYAAFPDLYTADQDAIATWRTAHASALDKLRRARAAPDCDWKVKLTKPFFMLVLPSLSGYRYLAKAAALAAVHTTRQGDEAAAIAHLRDNLALTANLRQMPTVIATMSAIATDGITTSTLEQLLPELGQQPAARGALRNLRDVLLDDADRGDTLARAFYTERLVALDVAEEIDAWRCSTSMMMTGWPLTRVDVALNAIFEPAWKLDAARMFEWYDQLAQMGRAQTLPAARQLSPDLSAASGDSDSRAHEVNHWVSSLLMPSFERAIELDFVNLTKRRLAATAIAIRLYELDHGQRPATLAELVPDYLAAVPEDPCTPAGTPLIYRPLADPPVLYGVGENSEDDGGVTRAALTRRQLRTNSAYDLVFFLDGDRPVERPSPPDVPPGR